MAEQDGDWLSLENVVVSVYKWFCMKLKGAVCKSYVRPAVLYLSEAWCLKESKMVILQRTEGNVYSTARR